MNGDLTCCGMPLRGGFTGDIARPDGALAVVRTLEADGSVAFRVLVTEGLGQAEALGFAEFARIYLAEEIRRNISWEDLRGALGGAHARDDPGNRRPGRKGPVRVPGVRAAAVGLVEAAVRLVPVRGHPGG